MSIIRSPGRGARRASSQSRADGRPLPRQAAGMRYCGPRLSATSAVHSATVSNSASMGPLPVMRRAPPDPAGRVALAVALRSGAFESADAKGPVAVPPYAFLRLANVGGRVLIHRDDTCDITRFEGGEGNGKVVALLQPRQATEIGQALALLFRHVVAVRQVGARDRRVPVIAADRG